LYLCHICRTAEIVVGIPGNLVPNLKPQSNAFAKYSIGTVGAGLEIFLMGKLVEYKNLVASFIGILEWLGTWFHDITKNY
jgi:hypothetical protein